MTKTLESLEEYEKDLFEKFKNEWKDAEVTVDHVLWYYNIRPNDAEKILENLVKKGLLKKRYGLTCENCDAEVDLDKELIEEIGGLSPETVEKLGVVTCQECDKEFYAADCYLTSFYSLEKSKRKKKS
jgi:hypothetical protein